jgi:hypothetical protein
MFCRSCGENIPVDSVFCPNCGKNLLDIAAPMPQSAIEPEPTGMFRRRVRVLDPEEEPEEDELDDDGPRRARSINLSLFERLGIQRLFWIMGLAFAVVGFVIGLAGRNQTAIIWILFGIALIVAAHLAPEPRPETEAPQEEASD